MTAQLPDSARAPSQLLLYAATLRATKSADVWPSQGALERASLHAHVPYLAAVWRALAAHRAVMADWPWADALELATRFVGQWPALADPSIAPGALRGWLDAEPRLLDWVKSDAWQAAGTDPELRDLLWGVQRAFAREVSADAASSISASYTALGLTVLSDGKRSEHTRLLVGTELRALQRLRGVAPRRWPDPQRHCEAQDDRPPEPDQPLERLAFEVGLKPVLRLDHVSTTDLPDVVARWQAAGLFALPGWQRYALQSGGKALRLSGSGLDLTCVFVARSELDAVNAATSDATEKAPVPRPDRDRATQALGSLLGYPACCTAAFLQHADQGANDDWCSLVARASSDGPHPWYVNTWRDLVEILPFCPCSWDCQRARAYGRRLTTALAERDPAGWAALRAQLHGVVVAWPRSARQPAGSVLLRDCTVERGTQGVMRVRFAQTLHWSQLAGVDSDPMLPDWLFVARRGGTLVRGEGGWSLWCNPCGHPPDAVVSVPGGSAPSQDWTGQVLVLDFQGDHPQDS